MTVCIHCAMKHVVESLEAGRAPGRPPFFEETPEEHTRRAHADMPAALRERADLERRLAALGTRASNAMNN